MNLLLAQDAVPERDFNAAEEFISGWYYTGCKPTEHATYKK